MSWKSHFNQGVALFKQGQRVEALEQFNQALTNGGKNQFILYDSRAAVHESLNNPKDALRDAKLTIKVAPQQWQGYGRAARLFKKTHKFDASLKMVDYALTYVKPEDHRRREEFFKLKQEILNTQEAVAARKRKMQNQMLKLPVEIYDEIFQFVMAEDNAQVIKLLHVCGHWRRIIWETPGLWHTLVLSKSRGDQKAALWLERSAGRIRELHVLPNYTSKQWPERPNFFQHIDWSHLHVCRIYQPDLIRHTEPHSMFRSLEQLEVDAAEQQLGATFFHSCTKLKSLSVLRTTLRPEHLEVPLPSLSSLSLWGCSFVLPMDFVPILNANPQLESLSLNVVMSVKVGIVPLEPSDFENRPSLEKLKTLEAIHAPWATSTLLLDIPVLQTLRIHYIYANSLSDHLTYWISTCPRSLTELSLRNIKVSKAILIRLVQAIPMIEVLELTELYGVSNSIIDALVEMEATTEEGTRLPCLCPRLRHLDVSNCADVETCALHALVKQRLALSAAGDGELGLRVSKLEVLKMDGCPRVDVLWVPWFREHVPVVGCIYAPKKTKRGVAKRVNGV